AGTHDSVDGRCGSYASIGRGQASTKDFRRYPQSAMCSPLKIRHERRAGALLVVLNYLGGQSLGAAVKDSISFMSRPRKAMPEWVVHCEVNQRHVRRSQPTQEAALKDACSQLVQGHAVNRIVGPNRTITAERVRDWCAKHRSSPTTQSPNSDI